MPLGLHAEYFLSIGTMFQNEAPYLKEWIEFHKIVGVEHFYLYSNFSTDNYQKVLQPYIENGEVTLIEYPERITTPEEFISVQAYAFTHCCQNADSKWLALIDTDEFLFPCQDHDLKDFLKKYESIPEIAVIYFCWYLYGTSYVDEIPKDRLLIEMLTKRCESASPVGKTILQPAKIDEIINAHIPKVKLGYLAVYTDLFPVITWNDHHIATQFARINHYWSRDRKYFHAVKSKRDTISFHAQNREWVKSFDEEPYNKVEDFAILRFTPELKRRMNLSR